MARLLEEFQLTHEAVAAAMGRSRSTITNLLRLLELDPQVRKLVETRELDMGHARALLALPAAHQAEAARQVVRGGLSARAAEALVRRILAAGKPGGKAKTAADPNIQSLERQLSEKLGAAVTIRHQRGGRGRLEVRYNSLDQLDGIINRFR